MHTFLSSVHNTTKSIFTAPKTQKKRRDYMLNPRKCAVIGCGNVGATIAYTYTQSGLFSEIILIDKNESRARGEAMDISHGVPFLPPVTVRAGEYRDLADAALIVIAAGVSQKEGQTRLDLLSANMRVFSAVVNEIVRYNTEAILLVVTNPVDILTYYTYRISGFPANRVIGSGTVLDTARLKQLMGEYLSVDPRNVHTFIIGEHGDSELPVWSGANISGIDLVDYFRVCNTCRGGECLDRMFENVRDAAYRIIEGKGATYYAIAQAVMRITECILRNENSVLTVSTLVDGHYGLSDLYLGVPAVVGADGVRQVLDISLSEPELMRLRESARTLRHEIEQAMFTEV